MARVQFRAQRSGFEEVRIEPKMRNLSGDRCAVLVRNGQEIRRFAISVAQVRAYRKGKKINITDGAIRQAETWGCK